MIYGSGGIWSSVIKGITGRAPLNLIGQLLSYIRRCESAYMALGRSMFLFMMPMCMFSVYGDNVYVFC